MKIDTVPLAISLIVMVMTGAILGILASSSDDEDRHSSSSFEPPSSSHDWDCSDGRGRAVFIEVSWNYTDDGMSSRYSRAYWIETIDGTMTMRSYEVDEITYLNINELSEEMIPILVIDNNQIIGIDIDQSIRLVK